MSRDPEHPTSPTLVPTTPKLVLASPGTPEQVFALANPIVNLGRAAINDVVLADTDVSRSHARIERRGQAWVVIDLHSTNGTLVNGARVHEAPLRSGDTIAVGSSTIRFEVESAPVEPVPERLDSEADLDRTLVQSSLSVVLRDTRAPRLVVHRSQGTAKVPLAGDVLTIGRSPDSDLVIDEQEVSRRHARVERRGLDFVLRDLGSANGTWVGPNRVTEHVLRDSDAFRVGGAQIVFKAGFTNEDLSVIEPGPSRGARPRRPVVFVPGLLGSELWRGSERFWPNAKILFTRPEVVRLPEFHPMEPRAVVGEMVIVPHLIKLETYNRLAEFLAEVLGYETGKDYLEFPYDWRQDLRDSARRLGAAIDAWPVAPPVTIIAHSLGCLVSRYYVECLGGKGKVERLILVGGPNYGAPTPLNYLIQGPAVFPFGLLGDRLRDLFATFPSFYQTLPMYGCVFDGGGRMIDVLADESWLADWQRPFLRSAREFRRELGTVTSVPTVSIFGYGLKTVSTATVETGADGAWQHVDFAHAEEGDDTVPEASGALKHSEIHPVHQHHGALYVDTDVKMRLKLELTR